MKKRFVERVGLPHLRSRRYFWKHIAWKNVTNHSEVAMEGESIDLKGKLASTEHNTTHNSRHLIFSLKRRTEMKEFDQKSYKRDGSFFCSKTPFILRPRKIYELFMSNGDGVRSFQASRKYSSFCRLYCRPNKQATIFARIEPFVVTVQRINFSKQPA